MSTQKPHRLPLERTSLRGEKLAKTDRAVAHPTCSFSVCCILIGNCLEKDVFVQYIWICKKQNGKFGSAVASLVYFGMFAFWLLTGGTSLLP